MHGGFRIFTDDAVGNPNKSMLFHVANANGYEALWLGSAMRYHAWTQGMNSVSTTGFKEISKHNASASLHAVKYYVSNAPPKAPWHMTFESGALQVYKNPNPMPVQSPFFFNSSIDSRGELFRVLDSGGFDPRKTLLTTESLEPRTIPESPTLAGIQHVRIHPNKIDSAWRSDAPCSFWAFLSEAFYPGWEAWTTKGEKLKVIEADGFFNAALYRNFVPPYERLLWIFRPKDFLIGAWGSVLSIICLAGLGITRARKLVQSLNS